MPLLLSLSPLCCQSSFSSLSAPSHYLSILRHPPFSPSLICKFPPLSAHTFLQQSPFIPFLLSPLHIICPSHTSSLLEIPLSSIGLSLSLPSLSLPLISFIPQAIPLHSLSPKPIPSSPPQGNPPSFSTTPFPLPLSPPAARPEVTPSICFHHGWARQWLLGCTMARLHCWSSCHCQALPPLEPSHRSSNSCSQDPVLLLGELTPPVHFLKIFLQTQRQPKGGKAKLPMSSLHAAWLFLLWLPSPQKAIPPMNFLACQLAFASSGFFTDGMA